MTKFSRTWWGDRFIKALEAFTDESRLQRGRSYAHGGKVLSFEIEQKSHHRSSQRINQSYFGVYKEPTYNISI